MSYTLIHGDKGEEKRMLSDISQGGVIFLSKGSRLEIIEGATHRFNDHLNKIADLPKSVPQFYLT